MRAKKQTRRLAVIILTLALATAGTANAASFLKAPESAPAVTFQSPLSQAWTWISEIWTDLAGLFAASGTTTPDGTTTSSCSNPEGCDVGWQIDPNG